MKLKGGAAGSVTMTFDQPEAELLREIPVQLRMLYESDTADPARERLFPRAYLDPTEEEAEQQWAALMHPELLRQRLEGLNAVLATLDAGEVKGKKLRVILTADDVSMWLAVLNDARLAFGTRLEISDDDDVYEFHTNDPLAAERAAYVWLTNLQGALVEVLLGTLPD